MKITNKTMRFWAAACLLGLLCTGCEKNHAPLFEERTSVYFKGSEYNFSFANEADLSDKTVSIPLAVYGRLSEEDRVVRAVLSQNEEHKNTADPALYTILEGIVPANSGEGRFHVLIRYDKLLDTATRTFYLEIAENDEFSDPPLGNPYLKVNFTAQEIEPENWYTLHLFLGYNAYSTRWYRFIKEATGLPYIPYDIFGRDPEKYWMTQDEMNQLVVMVKRALREYNELHPNDPLRHDDGTHAGQPIVFD